MTPTDLTDTFPAKFLAGVLLGVLGVVGLALRFALGWLIKRDETREARIEVLEKGALGLNAAIETKAGRADIGATGDRLTAAINASEAALSRQHMALATEVAKLEVRIDERTKKGG